MCDGCDIQGGGQYFPPARYNAQDAYQLSGGMFVSGGDYLGVVRSRFVPPYTTRNL